GASSDSFDRSPRRRPENIVHQTKKSSSASAPSASKTITSMIFRARNALSSAEQLLNQGMLVAGLTALVLAGCGTTPRAVLPPVDAISTTPAAAPTSAPAPAPASAGPAPGVPHPGSRWVAAAWSDLPGWEADQLILVWPALRASCTRPAPGWDRACAEALALAAPDETAVRAWMTSRLAPWRVESPQGDAQGLVTGYFEPLVDASRRRTRRFGVPLYAPPADLAARKPWYTRAEIGSTPAAQAALRGREIAYVADPMDALLLQIQGSGRLRLLDDADARGAPRVVRLAYGGHNDQPYRSVGRWLVERGAFTLEQASWPAIRSWARANPGRVEEMLSSNPRYVFFREEALPD